jgi:hypothetical protein
MMMPRSDSCCPVPVPLPYWDWQFKEFVTQGGYDFIFPLQSSTWDR